MGERRLLKRGKFYCQLNLDFFQHKYSRNIIFNLISDFFEQIASSFMGIFIGTEICLRKCSWKFLYLKKYPSFNLYVFTTNMPWSVELLKWLDVLHFSYPSPLFEFKSFLPQPFYIWLKSSLNSLFLSFCQNFRCIKSVDPLQANQWKENMDFAPHPYSNQIKV